MNYLNLKTTLILKTFSFLRKALLFLLFCFLLNEAHSQEAPVYIGESGDLVYEKDSVGNRIPDFSFCGFEASEQVIPTIPAAVFVAWTADDASLLIQQAIDWVSALPKNKNGFRGAVQLDSGTYVLKGRLNLHTSGVVLRGMGMGETGTRLIAEGKDRQTLIRILGKDQYNYDTPSIVSDSYVPVNAMTLTVGEPCRFNRGMNVMVHRPSDQEWIDKLGMAHLGGRESDYIGWKPGQRDLRWERTIVDISGDTLFLDAPLTTALDSKYGKSTVSPFRADGRICYIGIENLQLESAYDPDYPTDEDHCFCAITIEHAENVWVRRVGFKHFAGSAVAVYETGRKVTVEDCISEAPVSELGSWRRYSFFTMGQQTLFQRLYAEYGYHDFAVGFCAAGPNAFVECEAYLPHSFSGAIDSWASGVLFDNILIDGNRLVFNNRGVDYQGAGWTAANSVFWQCAAHRIENFAPPGAMNYAFGVWGQFEGNGSWFAQNNHISPLSLFYAQLSERLQHESSRFANQIRPAPGPSFTSPTLEQAQILSRKAKQANLTMNEWIRQGIAEYPLLTTIPDGTPYMTVAMEQEGAKVEDTTIALINGFITHKNKLMTGSRHTVPWWRGVARPYEADYSATPAITRFVPGRNGNGYTDNLQEVIEWMKENNIVGIEHNYGLWYDRRRDDHQRVRRMDSQVWAPFYEQAFARSGEGTAWDGLSKYDLTRFNHFYWSRLYDFATLARQNGKLLLQHHFFQHNILEAGAHWSDSPWRPVNNINNIEFTEPVHYAGDKRIFIAEQFYDITCEHRSLLYRNYIRKCLDNFDEEQAVLHLISAEYTGPLHFVEFWLDVIAEWQVENNRKAYIVLSTTKDVQDAILSQPDRALLIDVIDIRYWAYREDGTLYAPLGGKNLAPRQHARIESSGKRSFHSVFRSISEYKKKLPNKAVIYSERQFDRYGWATLFAGGSLPVLPPLLPEEFTESVISMNPDFSVVIPDKLYLLHNYKDALIWMDNVDCFVFEQAENGKYMLTSIDVSTGEVIHDIEVYADSEGLRVINTLEKPVVIWLKKISTI